MYETQFNRFKAVSLQAAKKFAYIFDDVRDAECAFNVVLLKYFEKRKDELHNILDREVYHTLKCYSIDKLRASKTEQRSKYRIVSDEVKKDATNATNVYDILIFDTTSIADQALLHDEVSNLYLDQKHDAINTRILDLLSNDHSLTEIARILNLGVPAISKRISKIRRSYLSKFGNPLIA